MSVSPSDAIAGRDISFSMTGLTPWEVVTVSFIDPQSVAASWITAEDVHILRKDQMEATSISMYPTAAGDLNWERYGAQDETGTWSMKIELTSSVHTVNYTLNNLKLGDVETVTLGILLTRHLAPDLTIYYSDLVPTALVADLREHLRDTAFLLDRRLQTETGQIPDVYLMGNRELMAEVSSVTGVDQGFEDGYYKNFGQRPGIYMRTDLKGTEVRRVLTHEYIHHLFDSLANGNELPAWVTEGLSRYYEFDTASSGPRPDASELREFGATDLARSAAQAGTLFSLATLDSQGDWNARTDKDELALQYAESYMAVRFLNETYGPMSGKDVVTQIGLGNGLSHAIRVTTGLGLDVFESQFNRWLQNWEDPDRGPIAEYLAALDAILADQDVSLDQRSQDLSANLPASEASIRRVARLTSTEALLDRIRSLSLPERTSDLHQETVDYLSRVLEWLTLEFKHADTLDDSYRIAGNAMIPEIDARDFTLKRNLSNLKFILNLEE